MEVPHIQEAVRNHFSFIIILLTAADFKLFIKGLSTFSRSNHALIVLYVGADEGHLDARELLNKPHERLGIIG